MRNLFLYITLLFCISCQSTKGGKQVVGFEKMKKVVWELMQSEDYYTKMSFLDSTLKGKHKNIDLYEQIFEMNKISAKDFYTTVDYYEKHPVLFKELMDSVASLSKKEKIIINKPIKNIL